jgi:hypothetical protein
MYNRFLRRPVIRILIVALIMAAVLAVPVSTKAAPPVFFFTYLRVFNPVVHAGGTVVAEISRVSFFPLVGEWDATCLVEVGGPRTDPNGMTVADYGDEYNRWGWRVGRTYWLDADEPGRYLFTCYFWLEGVGTYQVLAAPITVLP